MDRNLVVLDPAHGGQDAGATLGDRVQEKDVTLALAERLRAALTAAGFTVASTRDADTTTPPTEDQRAEIANRTHPLACLVLHATASGSGIHLYTSELQPAQEETNTNPRAASGAAFAPVRWEMAQAGYVDLSLHLVSDLSAALGKANLPSISGRAAVRPLDNMMCPAVAIELAPLPVADGEAAPVTDAAYQQRVVATLATALAAWRDHAASSATQATATATHGAETSSPPAQAQAAVQAAEEAAAEARAAAESAGKTAARLAANKAAAEKASASSRASDRPVPDKPTTDKPQAAVGVPVGGEGRTPNAKPGGAAKAGPASSSDGSSTPAAETEGGE